MPRTPIDYKKAVIYMIVCKTNSSLLYIGSTTDFRKRKGRHKYNCNNETSKVYSTPVYVMIRANGGWDAFEMKPVKEYPCENKIQIIIEEERIRKEMDANLNAKKAHITEEEKQEYKKNYNQQNKEHITEYKKEYRQQTKEEILEYQKEYRKKNRDNLNQQRREKRKKLS